MEIDAASLRRRIAEQRLQLREAVRPAAANAQPFKTEPPAPAQDGALARLYRMPVIGRVARTAALIVNLPPIVSNLSRHYAAYHAEIRRLNRLIMELEHRASETENALSQRILRLERRVGELERSDSELGKSPDALNQ